MDEGVSHNDGTESQLMRNNFEMNTLDVTSDGGIWTGECSNTAKENHSTKPKKKDLNKVDILVMEVSLKIRHQKVGTIDANFD